MWGIPFNTPQTITNRFAGGIKVRHKSNRATWLKWPHMSQAAVSASFPIQCRELQVIANCSCSHMRALTCLLRMFDYYSDQHDVNLRLWHGSSCFLISSNIVRLWATLEHLTSTDYYQWLRVTGFGTYHIHPLPPPHLPPYIHRSTTAQPFWTMNESRSQEESH